MDRAWKFISVALTLTVVPMPLFAQALRGVWKPVEVKVSGGQSTPPADGLLIFTETHYSITLPGGAAAGRYELTDIAIVTTPSAVTGGGVNTFGPEALGVQLVADSLWVTTHQWFGAGVEARVKLVRVAGQQVAQRKESGRMPETDASTIVGRWTLNLRKSEFTPGPPPSSIQQVYERAGAEIRFTSTLVDADGKTTTEQWTGTEDGRDFPLTGSPDIDVLSIRVNGRQAQYVAKRGGRVTMGGNRSISSDGKTMTITISGRNAQDQVVKQVLVLERH
jgi:hypothetical protein